MVRWLRESEEKEAATDMKEALLRGIGTVLLIGLCLLLIPLSLLLASGDERYAGHLREQTAGEAPVSGSPAGSVGQVNLHIGQSADTVYLTCTSSEESEGPVLVTGPAGETSYETTSDWSDDAGKYFHTAVLTGLLPGTRYRYTLENGAYSSEFTTASQSGPFTFAFLTDPQIAHTVDSRAAAAVFDALNRRNDLAFIYMAGDLTDGRTEHQWDLFFNSEGVHEGAGQRLLGSHLLAAAQGNHDRSTFNGHITAPSAGEAVGNVVYAFDYSNVKFIVLNTNHEDTWEAQADFLRREAAEGKAAGQWVVVGFHHALYPGAGHIVDEENVSARKFWTPLLSELGVDVVLQGHNHVYARGFVTDQGTNANLSLTRNAYPAGSGVPLYITGGESGACKWYEAEDYTVPEGDLLAPGYSFLDINSAIPARNPWGTNTGETREQTWVLISVDGGEMRFQTYMLSYDGEADAMIKEPYLYDDLILRRTAP